MLAVDPGAKAGWSFWEGDRMHSSAACRGDDVHEVNWVIDTYRPGLLVIEDQYPGTDAAWKGIKTLIRRRCMWEVMAMHAGALVVEVTPATWQAWARVTPGAKDQYITIATGLVDVDRGTLGPDEAVALLIGYWWQGITTVPTAVAAASPGWGVVS